MSNHAALDHHRSPVAADAPGLATRVGGRLLPPVRLGSRARRRQAAENRAIRHVLTYTPLITQGGKRHKTIALTFDDGPGPQTHQLIRELRKLHVPATFFQVAQMVDARPRVARLEHREGFAVGSHSVTHPFLPQAPSRRAAHRDRRQRPRDRGDRRRLPAPLPPAVRRLRRRHPRASCTAAAC